MPSWTDTDCLDALHTAAEMLGEPLGYHEYRRWRKWVRGEYPDASTIVTHFDTWQRACVIAGVGARRQRNQAYGPEDYYLAAGRVYRYLGAWPTTEEYRERRVRGEPNVWTIYQHWDSWGDFIDETREFWAEEL